MEPVTILNNHHNIYWEKTQLNNTDLNNKLFCTFVTEDILEEMVSSISNTYDIMYNKMLAKNILALFYVLCLLFFVKYFIHHL